MDSISPLTAFSRSPPANHVSTCTIVLLSAQGYFLKQKKILSYFENPDLICCTVYLICLLRRRVYFMNGYTKYFMNGYIEVFSRKETLKVFKMGSSL